MDRAALTAFVRLHRHRAAIANGSYRKAAEVKTATYRFWSPADPSGQEVVRYVSLLVKKFPRWRRYTRMMRRHHPGWGSRKYGQTRPSILPDFPDYICDGNEVSYSLPALKASVSPEEYAKALEEIRADYAELQKRDHHNV